MNIEISYLALIAFFRDVFVIIWTLTIVRNMWGHYRDERYYNSAVCSVFCGSVMFVIAYLASVHNPPTATSVKFSLPEVSKGTIFYYGLTSIFLLRLLFNFVLVRIYRALIESDKAKDKRFGVVQIQHR